MPSPHHVLLLCCLLQGLQEGQGLRIGMLVALGECHGAEVKNGRGFFLFVSGPVLKAPVLGSFRDSQGVLCAMYGRYVHVLEAIWARYEG